VSGPQNNFQFYLGSYTNVTQNHTSHIIAWLPLFQNWAGNNPVANLFNSDSTDKTIGSINPASGLVLFFQGINGVAGGSQYYSFYQANYDKGMIF